MQVFSSTEHGTTFINLLHTTLLLFMYYCSLLSVLSVFFAPALGLSFRVC